MNNKIVWRNLKQHIQVLPASPFRLYCGSKQIFVIFRDFNLLWKPKHYLHTLAFHFYNDTSAALAIWVGVLKIRLYRPRKFWNDLYYYTMGKPSLRSHRESAISSLQPVQIRASLLGSYCFCHSSSPVHQAWSKRWAISATVALHSLSNISTCNLLIKAVVSSCESHLGS